MSQNNNDNSGFAAAAGFVFAGLLIMGAFIFAIAAFIAFVLTLLSFLAWNAELKLGKFVLTPEEARGFVYRGLAGALLLPVFAIFACVLFDIRIIDEAWLYLIIGGYTLGSVGIALMEAQAQEEQAKADAAAQAALPAPQSQPPARPIYLRQSPEEEESEPFRFATWDDEERRS